MGEKIAGYILIFFGILIIIFSSYSVYTVFMGISRPYPLFNFDAISLQITPPEQTIEIPEEIKKAGISVKAEKPKPITQELVSKKVINDSSNIFAHLFLMGFLTSAGYKIAMLGIHLSKTIVVKPKMQNKPPAA